jgi:hypothetical protein
MRIAGAILGGLVVGALILKIAGAVREPPGTTTRLVAENASGELRRIAIHYAPDGGADALPIYRELVRALPQQVELVVEVARAEDFDAFLAALPEARARARRVVVGVPITTWSRDRYAALVDRDGGGAILAPPRIETPFRERAGDMQSAEAVSLALYDRAPRISEIVFEGGDLAATPNLVFADANLANRNAGRGVGRSTIDRELRRRFSQQVVWLGEAAGDVPRHHIMMYMVPIDDHTVVVGDVRAGVKLLDRPLALDDIDVQAARFDRVAALLTARGYRVLRAPVLVLAGAGAYVTYTNALFDRRGDTPIVYMPTYALPALDNAGAAFWRAQGFEVHPIDLSTLYELGGSLGCLVNVLERD